MQPAVGTLGLSVRCVKGYCVVVLTETDDLPLDTDRASLQRVTCLALMGTDALPLDTGRASLQRVTRPSGLLDLRN